MRCGCSTACATGASRPSWSAAACATCCSGIEPKDFDVATDALPEQVKRLFRNCRLVGRRFRLAHVFFGREIIEVATFRAATAPSPGEEPIPVADLDDEQVPGLEEGELESRRRRARSARRPCEEDSDERAFDASGRILRDNVYGTIDEDVWRRDFTCNSLYYNIADFSHLGLRERRGRRGRAHAAHDRRPGDALSRGPGAHAARGALRGEARLQHRSGHGGPDRRAAGAAGRGAAGAPVR